jgi:TRAP-type C4-dicarboxylate transport system substrate-binding protein
VVSAGNGEIEVDITFNIMDEGRPNTDLFDLVESGRMFFCFFSSSYLGDRVPELDVIETPYLFDDLPAAHRALDGALGARLTEAVRSRTGFEVLGFWDNGFRHITNRLRTVRTPEDLAGMTVRMQPNEIHEELIRCWGATPIAVELREAVELISSGKVDAQDNPLANTFAYGVDKVHRFVTMSGHLYGARGLFAHGQTYWKMDNDLRAMTDDAVRHAIEVQRSAAARLEEALRMQLESDGHEVVELTELEREGFAGAAGPAIEMAHREVPRELFDLVGSGRG